MAMDELAEKIRGSIENRSGDPWFPELTIDLAARAWERLRRDIGLTPETYGTERVLSHSRSGPRKIIGSVALPPLCEAATSISIEGLSDESAAKYHKEGVSFYAPDEIFSTTVLPCLEDALLIVNQVPSLMRTVTALVRSLHVIAPEDADYDVSFSEPDVPFSIFVSVPRKPTANDALRVAEAIVHEAMHLQLTQIECVSHLVSSADGRYFSPWRGEHRNAGAVLHGLYVFYVIHRFLDRLASIGSGPENWLQYRRRRQREIANQIDAIRSLQDGPELTAAGLTLVRRCLQDSAFTIKESISIG
jgi:hypothetical protein